jgi:hypothetical protein
MLSKGSDADYSQWSAHEFIGKLITAFMYDISNGIVIDRSESKIPLLGVQSRR